MRSPFSTARRESVSSRVIAVTRRRSCKFQTWKSRVSSEIR
ncbi:hypothetical protein A8926_0143 [Saccharopolyspora spinosa]|uniref:Uncharacterized protein n=1 Tax=Saccharopolyspora spinosa TaxID=60894 RepID=A0A2N3XQ09_SACSN|nr:hypothetical protein A8926_0143 [Saccharopolyspora spinosa]